MIMRTARLQDCPMLAALDAQCNPSPWSPTQFQAALNNRFTTIQLFDENNTVNGFAVWQTLCGESELHLLAITPAHRRTGLASQLMSAWLDTASQQLLQRFFLEVRASNHAAQALYRKHGFAEYNRRKNYYSLPSGQEDAVLMEKLC